MTTHKLKILPEYFNAVADGSKRFEYRLNDRDFQVGDTLVLREWTVDKGVPYHGFYLGREIRCRVTYVLPVPFVDSSHAVLSIADVEVTP